MTENKRFMIDDAGELIDKETAQFIDYGEKVCELLNDLADEKEQLKTIKNQYKGQKEYLLWVIGRNCRKELFDIVKSHLKDIEGGDVE